MEWIVALIVLLLGFAFLPSVIRASKSHAKGGIGGAVMMLGMMFSGLFDPAQKSAIEEVAKRKDLGEEADVAGGGLE